MMKKEYTAAYMEIIEFYTEDVIITSNGYDKNIQDGLEETLEI